MTGTDSLRWTPELAAKFRPKILVVDDEPEARESLAHLLKAKGYEVLEEASGRPVLERAKAGWPSLIILDLVLPDLPGTEVFKQLRSDPITKAIPVLLLSAKPDLLEQLPSFQEKFDGYVEKPERIEDLLRKVREMLTGR